MRDPDPTFCDTAPETSAPDASGLWEVTAFGEEHWAAGRRYWWDNAPREPAHLLVVQQVLAGRIDLWPAPSQDAPRPEPIPLGPGDCFVFAYGEPTRYGRPQPLEQPLDCRWVNLRGAGLRAHLDALRDSHGPVLRCGVDHAVSHQLQRLIQFAQPQARTGRTALAHEAHALVMEMYDFADQRRMQGLTPAGRAVERILRQPCFPWSLKRLAAEAGCTREHLSRAFRKQTGTPPARYLSQRRIARAQRLLRETNLSVRAIARQVGFRHAHNLARHLRRATGQSPTQFRAQPSRPSRHPL